MKSTGLSARNTSFTRKWNWCFRSLLQTNPKSSQHKLGVPLENPSVRATFGNIAEMQLCLERITGFRDAGVADPLYSKNGHKKDRDYHRQRPSVGRAIALASVGKAHA